MRDRERGAGGAQTDMRMGIGVGGCPVGGPPRVADGDRAVEWLVSDEGFEAGQASCGLEDVDCAVFIEDREARGIVAPVFEPPEALEDQAGRPAEADVADDAAHLENPGASG